jgi:hypothetical protein
MNIDKKLDVYAKTIILRKGGGTRARTLVLGNKISELARVYMEANRLNASELYDLAMVDFLQCQGVTGLSNQDEPLVLSAMPSPVARFIDEDLDDDMVEKKLEQDDGIPI